MAPAFIKHVIGAIGAVRHAAPAGQSKTGADIANNVPILRSANPESFAMEAGPRPGYVGNMERGLIRSDDGRGNITASYIRPPLGAAINRAMPPANYRVGLIWSGADNIFAVN